MIREGKLKECAYKRGASVLSEEVLGGGEAIPPINLPHTHFSWDQTYLQILLAIFAYCRWKAHMAVPKQGEILLE